VTWFAFQNDSSVYELNGLAEKQLVATLAHGYATETLALAHRNKPASPDQAILLAGFKATKSANQGGLAGVIAIDIVNSKGQNTGSINVGNNPVTNVGADIFKGLNLGSWFLRVGEILLGLVLIGVGIARITGVQNAVSAAVKTKLLPV
jgi:hypothetical protein